MSGCRQFKLFTLIQLEKQESIFFQLQVKQQSRWNLYLGQPNSNLLLTQLLRTRNQVNSVRFYFNANSCGKSLPFSAGYRLNRRVDWVIRPEERWAQSRNLALDNCFYDCSILGYRVHDQVSVVEKNQGTLSTSNFPITRYPQNLS